jgi:hypothetical protein
MRMLTKLRQLTLPHKFVQDLRDHCIDSNCTLTPSFQFDLKPKLSEHNAES